MFGVIRLSDKATHGGIVLEGSSSVIFMGLPVSYMLDKVFCPIRGETTIIEGDSGSRINGKPITLHDHRCGYGCTSISLLLVTRKLQYMPIDFKKIPEKTELPVLPGKLRWLITTLLCVVFGVALVFSLWHENESTYTIWLWFYSLSVPFLISFMGYVFRLRYYENKCNRIIWWNHLHQQQHDEQVAIEKLAMGMLAAAYITLVARDKLTTALS